MSKRKRSNVLYHLMYFSQQSRKYVVGRKCAPLIRQVRNHLKNLRIKIIRRFALAGADADLDADFWTGRFAHADMDVDFRITMYNLLFFHIISHFAKLYGCERTKFVCSHMQMQMRISGQVVSHLRMRMRNSAKFHKILCVRKYKKFHTPLLLT